MAYCVGKIRTTFVPCSQYVLFGNGASPTGNEVPFDPRPRLAAIWVSLFGASLLFRNCLSRQTRTGNAMTNTLQDPSYWRERAEETRTKRSRLPIATRARGCLRSPKNMIGWLPTLSNGGCNSKAAPSRAGTPWAVGKNLQSSAPVHPAANDQGVWQNSRGGLSKDPRNARSRLMLAARSFVRSRLIGAIRKQRCEARATSRASSISCDGIVAMATMVHDERSKRLGSGVSLPIALDRAP
jgi:hypothetical protein